MSLFLTLTLELRGEFPLISAASKTTNYCLFLDFNIKLIVTAGGSTNDKPIFS